MSPGRAVLGAADAFPNSTPTPIRSIDGYVLRKSVLETFLDGDQAPDSPAGGKQLR